MAGGAVVPSDGSVADYGGGLTLSVFMTCLVAASGGLIFGYDIGISAVPEALLPAHQGRRATTTAVYDSQALAAFTSSLYVAGAVASLVASRVTRALGQEAIMLLGGALFFAGAAVSQLRHAHHRAHAARLRHRVHHPSRSSVPRRDVAAAVARRSDGRHAVLPHARHTHRQPHQLRRGARVLGLAPLPRPRGRAGRAAIFVGALFLTDTPSSLVMRGRAERPRRGRVDVELKEITRAVEAARQSEDGAFRRMTTRREYRPYLVTGVVVFAVALPVFIQLTGVIVLSFFSPPRVPDRRLRQQTPRSWAPSYSAP
ncbi:hypothetical protein U9M48_010689 [Paspalum notatum var. saurae]|uniref:Major facilitator superfamily (MFS) profile domain-containing protein n=1 Tax=Paspalum notatum var. saurae TaxID=547442 RepID=A0AAQ3WGS3_PASNO